ncbi:MAG: peptidoglycan-associated lipoprotein Pal [Candidatus Hydrogenedentes bacterium]|nr:peptidoglycan-associated lipoprotein Pal [Candidatus Hydrogenedentota bacterium]
MKTKQMTKTLLVGLAVVLAIGMTTGCQRKKPIETLDSGFGSEPTGPETTTTGDGLPDMDMTDILFEPGSQYGLQTVYFDYDSNTLRADAMTVLRENAEKIKQVPGVVIQLAGHCDERGTQEYNLALGERRALAVRQYLIQMGISGDRLITISYGKEFPSVLGSNESAWAKNRRAEFNRAR